MEIYLHIIGALLAIIGIYFILHKNDKVWFLGILIASIGFIMMIMPSVITDSDKLSERSRSSYPSQTRYTPIIRPIPHLR